MFLIPFLLALVAAEIAVSPATPVPGAFAYNGVTVAANGDRALVVWHDHRGMNDIYAARIDTTGKVLDPAGIRLMHGDAEFAVAPAPDGGWLVAIANTITTGAAVVRVSRDGALSPKKIEPWWEHGPPATVQMATNGETFLIVVNGDRALLVGLDGDVVAGPLTLPALGFLPVAGFPRTAVASNGRDYVIVTSGKDGVTASVVTRAGVLGAPQTPFPGIHANGVAIVSDGNRYFIAAAVPQAGIVTAFAAADGTILAARQYAQQLNVRGVRAVTDGRDFGLVWSVVDAGWGHPLLYGSPVDASGGIANPQQLSARVTGDPPAFDLTDLAGNILLVHSADSRLFGTFTSIGVMNGPLLPDVPIQKMAATQVHPLLTATSAGAVVVWHDDEKEGWRAETLDRDGRPSGRVVDLLDASGPHVAFDGIDVVVAWRRNDGALVAQRFDTALNAVDVQPIVITTTNVAPTLAAGGGTALFAWTSLDASAGSDGAHGAILTRNGAVVPVALPQLPVPAAAWNGSEFLVVYAFRASSPPPVGSHPDPPDDVRALRVAPDGRVLDAAPQTIAHAFGAIGQMAAASNGGRFIVAWRTAYWQGYGDGAPSPVIAQSVDANGAPAGTRPVALSPNDPNEGPYANEAYEGPYLTPYGSGYAVAWQSRAPVEQKTLLWRTTESGTIASLPPMVLGSTAGDAAIAAIGERLVLAYSHIDDTVGGVERVFVRSVGAPERRRASR